MKIVFGTDTIDLTKNGDKYGVENLKQIASDMYSVWDKAVKRSEGGFNLIEVIRTAFDVVGVATDVVAGLNDIRNEIFDLSEEEAAEVALHLAKKFNISSEDAREVLEFVIIETIDLVFKGIRVFSFIKRMKDKNK